MDIYNQASLVCHRYLIDRAFLAIDQINSQNILRRYEIEPLYTSQIFRRQGFLILIFLEDWPFLCIRRFSFVGMYIQETALSQHTYLEDIKLLAVYIQDLRLSQSYIFRRQDFLSHRYSEDLKWLTLYIQELRLSQSYIFRRQDFLHRIYSEDRIFLVTYTIYSEDRTSLGIDIR